jgi:SAM-dependent methyltransferase
VPFDAVADAYDRYRLSPPPAVIDAIVEMSDVYPGSRVLEIGCGTGQASVLLAECGVELVAVERGPQLAERARRNLESYPNAHVDVGSFEDWPLPEQPFDAVVCVNAFHWLDPEVRFTKAFAALRTGGALTIAHAHHVRGGTPGFFEATQPLYVKAGLSDGSFRLPAPHEIAPAYPDLTAAHRRNFEIPMTLSTEGYVGWLKTDSLILSLDASARSEFLRGMQQLIDAEYHGEVARNWLYEVISVKSV